VIRTTLAYRDGMMIAVLSTSEYSFEGKRMISVPSVQEMR
jgi:hypothetical protein